MSTCESCCEDCCGCGCHGIYLKDKPKYYSVYCIQRDESGAISRITWDGMLYPTLEAAKYEAKDRGEVVINVLTVTATWNSKSDSEVTWPIG